LFIIEYASNIIVFVFTNISTFMINYDFESRMSFNFIESFELTQERILTARNVDMTRKMQNVMKFTKRKLIKI
jgi:NADH/NAD ratio-sensing transcriptional regulator Rex